MKLLLDQGLPRSAAELLRQAGIDAVHVGEIGHSSAEDSVILDLGRDLNCVVVTLDADFHALLAATGALAPSVIRIRIEGLRGEAVTVRLKTVIAKCHSELDRGAAITVQTSRIRVRHLPLVSG